MDDLDNLLSPHNPPSGDGRLREQVWWLTSRGLRRRRLVRRVGFVAVAAVIYATGLGTAWLMSSRPNSVEPVAARHADAPPESASPIEEPSPVTLEWQAFESERPRPDLYRRAGDLYLAANDVPGALRCYRSALRLSPGAGTEFDVNDSWLLMTLKAERRKGVHDAGNHS